MGKQLRFDIYYGYRDEGGPRDRHQIFFDIQADDIDELGELAANLVQDFAAELINEYEEGDYETDEPVIA